MLHTHYQDVFVGALQSRARGSSSQHAETILVDRARHGSIQPLEVQYSTCSLYTPEYIYSQHVSVGICTLQSYPGDRLTARGSRPR